MAEDTLNPFADDETATAKPTAQPWEGETDSGGGDQPGGGGTTPWQQGLYETLLPTLESLAREQGMFPGVMETWLSRNYTSMLNYIDDTYLTQGPQIPLFGGPLTPIAAIQTAQAKNYFTNTVEGLNSLVGIGLQWVAGKVPGFAVSRSGSTATGPKPINVRAQFDVSQLASQVSDMTRAYLLQEAQDPRAVARAYVDAVVKNPEQKLDFETFVIDHLKGNARWTTLYKNKPSSLNELQYMQQYASIGQGMLGANRGQDWSGEQFHAMAMGADPQAWEQRLQRSNSFTSQAPFVAKLQERVAGLSHVLKG